MNTHRNEVDKIRAQELINKNIFHFHAFLPHIKS